MESSLEKNKLRADFPALTQKIRGKSLIYLDSAATALKPWKVIERISHFYTYETANVHRGAHYLADLGTKHFEETREKVKSLISANCIEEIVFTSGTTGSINLVAQCLGNLVLEKDDEIIISEMEHHSNIVPWQMLCERVGAKLKIAPIDDSGELLFEELQKLLSSKTKIVAVTHCSNTLGTYVDVKRIAEMAHKVGALVVVDGAQAIATIPVNVQDLNVDFYAFSGHKMFGPYGIGVLFGKREWLEKMSPYQGGGNMISTVDFEKTTYNDLPFKFEAGTPNIESVIALGTAIDYINGVGFERIHQIEMDLLAYATAQVEAIPGIRILGKAQKKAPVLSMVLEGLHHSDVAQILDQEGIAVRAGHHCTMPLLKRFNISGTVRASFSIFNQKSDVDALVRGLIKAKEMLS
jgi:cysteine desulfurase/selenocysteine lyase